MILKLFTQPSCPRCPAAKQLVKQVENKIRIEHYDVQTEDGLAEALSYNIMGTPSIVILDVNKDVVGEWRSEVPTIDTLNTIIK